MSPVAFALKAGLDDECVGSVFLNNQRDFNIREALQEGRGQIVTEDPLVIDRLDGLDTLKRVSVEASKPAKARSVKKDDSDEESQATTESTGA